LDELPPERLDLAIMFATPGSLVPLALLAVRKGGPVICAGIYMSDIPGFPAACFGRNASSSPSPTLRARMDWIFSSPRRRSAL
jgi:hypothetical protein